MLLTTDMAILITGASGGIGLEIAAQAAAEGAVVGVHGSRLESVETAISQLRDIVPAGKFIACPANYEDNSALPEMVAHFAEKAGRIDAVVDCAIYESAVNITGVFANLAPEAFRQISGSAATLQELCHAALPHLAKQGGAIVAFASDSGRFAAPRQSLVGAKQAAVIGFVRNIALEVARDGVRVNCISPSFVEATPLFARFYAAAEGRAEQSRRRAKLGLPTPRDIAPLALFLCGPNAAKITGQVISVNGGLNA